jgi:hypothetical protein
MMNPNIIQKKFGNLNYYVDINNKSFIVTSQDISVEEIKNIILHRGKTFPFLLFVGKEIEPNLKKQESLQFLPIKRRHAEFYYKLKDDPNTYRVAIKVNLSAEFLPVWIEGITSLKELDQIKLKKYFDTIIFAPNLNRLEVLQLRMNFPKSRLIKAGNYIPEEIRDLKELEKHRITDVVNKLGVEFISKNPVYSARYYLRKLDFNQLYELPIKIVCTESDIEVIMTFLDIVIKNEHKNKELEINKDNLILLKKYYEFILYIIKKDYNKLEEFYDQSKEFLLQEPINSYLFEFLKSYKNLYRNRNIPKEEEIQLWEIETLIKLQEKKYS